MRIVIDIQQAPGSSYVHLVDKDAVEEAILGLCVDEDAQVVVDVRPAAGEDTTTVQFRPRPSSPAPSSSPPQRPSGAGAPPDRRSAEWTREDADAHAEGLFALMDGRSDQYVMVDREGTRVAYGPMSEDETVEFLADGPHLPSMGPDYWLRLPLAMPTQVERRRAERGRS